MDRYPLVSVIINNFNYERYLGEAIESALNQTYGPFEVIVVDDGSTDGSRDIIASYGTRIRSVLKENGGQGSAYNAGIKASLSEIVCFLDSDDIWLPSKLENTIKAMTADPENVLAYHQTKKTDAEGNIHGDPWPKTLLQGFIADRVLASGGWWACPPSSALVFRKDFLARIGGVPESNRYGADSYLSDLAPFFGKVAGVREVLGLYRVHDRNNFAREVPPEEWRGKMQERIRRLEKRVEMLNHNLERFGRDARVRLEDNLDHQRMKCLLGEGNGRLGLGLLALRQSVEPDFSKRVKKSLGFMLKRA